MSANTANPHQHMNRLMFELLDPYLTQTPTSPRTPRTPEEIFTRAKTAFVGRIHASNFPRISPKEATAFEKYFDIYFPALFTLFHHGDQCHKKLWDSLLLDPSSPENLNKNFRIPIPHFYAHAKRIILYPRGPHSQYSLSDKMAERLEHLQQNIATRPRTSCFATSLLLALNPSIFSISIGLFTWLSALFKLPQEHKEIRKTLGNIATSMALFFLMGNLIFPLVLKTFVDHNFPLPFSELMIFSGLLVSKFLLELKFALNCYGFENQKAYQIEGTPKALSQAVIRNTSRPFILPVIGSLAISLTLLMPKNLLLESILSLSKIYSLLNGILLIAKFARQKGKPHDLIALALVGLNITPGVLKTLGHLTQQMQGIGSCKEIQEISIFGIPTLSIPDPADCVLEPSCHEGSGLVWAIQRAGSSTLHFFTADSLRKGYSLVPDPFLTTECPWSDLAVMPISSRAQESVLDNFCGLDPWNYCDLSNNKPVRVIMDRAHVFHSAEDPAITRVARLVTTAENYAYSQQAAATVFLGIEAGQHEGPPGAGPES